MEAIRLLIRKARNLGIGGFVRELGRRFSPRSIWHGKFSKNRKVIKMMGVGNDPNETLFYPSVYHFLHNVSSLFAPRDYDYLLAQSYFNDEFLSCQKPKLFFTREPIPSLILKTREHIKSERLNPYIYSYEDPDIEKRMFYVVFYKSKNGFIKNLQRSVTVKRDKLCCIINRYSENKACNLVLKRIEFVKAMGRDVDIYGAEPGIGPNKWKTFPNYNGMTHDKLKTLGLYNFVLAFENTDYPGYITEKIIHAFMAGAVPLYWGGGIYLKESIPSNCYIDCRDQEPAKIHKMIKTMTPEEIISYRIAAIDFLKSNAADQFTRKYWAEEVVKRLELQDSDKNREIGNYRV
ncbi:MAG: glycosyltransferase family 10 domain-containing protein [Thermodesulfobacteriota bacterium]